MYYEIDNIDQNNDFAKLYNPAFCNNEFVENKKELQKHRGIGFDYNTTETFWNVYVQNKAIVNASMEPNIKPRIMLANDDR